MYKKTKFRRKRELKRLCKKVIPFSCIMLVVLIFLTIITSSSTVESKSYEDETCVEEESVKETVNVTKQDIPLVYDEPETIPFIKFEKPEIIYKYNISDEDRLFFEQIISAEAYSYWTVEECLALASVVINRVEANNGGFRNVDTIREVLEQKNAFETYSNGRYLKVPVSESAKQAVDLALQGKTNMSEDILFFCTIEYYETTDADSMWRAKLDLKDKIRNVVFFSLKK